MTIPLLLAAAALAAGPSDGVRLRFSDGGEVSGRLISADADSITLGIAGGTIEWPRSAVASIEHAELGELRAPDENVERGQPPFEAPRLGFPAPTPAPEPARTAPERGQPPFKQLVAVFLPPPVVVRTITPEERARALKALEARRAKFKSEHWTSPYDVGAFRYRLQEAIDRHALGLGFSSQPF